MHKPCVIRLATFIFTFLIGYFKYTRAFYVLSNLQFDLPSSMISWFMYELVGWTILPENQPPLTKPTFLAVYNLFISYTFWNLNKQTCFPPNLLSFFKFKQIHYFFFLLNYETKPPKKKSHRTHNPCVIRLATFIFTFLNGYFKYTRAFYVLSNLQFDLPSSMISWFMYELVCRTILPENQPPIFFHFNLWKIKVTIVPEVMVHGQLRPKSVDILLCMASTTSLPSQ